VASDLELQRTAMSIAPPRLVEATCELAIDVGSEFVDLVLRSQSGRRIRKVPVAGRPWADAVLAATDAALAEWSVALAVVDTVRIGSTGAINALLTRRGARIALLATQGFGDCLRLGRQNRASLHDPVAQSPSPTFLVDRVNTFEIGGRMDATGCEIAPLDEAAIRRAAEQIHDSGIEAVAVCFLFGHVNPAHELRCRALLGELLRGCEICLSHEVDPQPREYERTVSVCLEAWLRPMTARAMTALEHGLRQRKFAGELFYGDGRSSLRDRTTARACVVHLLASGPAASARCALVTAHTVDAPTAISIDIGSTSADLALIYGGELETSRHTIFAGVPLRQDMVDLASVALGGNSRVMQGDQGRITFATGEAHAADGPTLTDALALLGRIPADRARDAPLVLLAFGKAIGKDDARTTALEIVEAAERKLAASVFGYAVRRNVDPSLTPLIAMGGLGGVLGPGIAALLGMPRLVCPEAPAVAGALGLLMAEPRFDATARVEAWTHETSASTLAPLLARLAAAIRAQAKIDPDDVGLRASVEMAANPHMHPHHVVLSELPPDGAVIAAAFKTQYSTGSASTRPTTAMSSRSLSVSPKPAQCRNPPRAWPRAAA
jgi:N-methylhydantoinase A